MSENNDAVVIVGDSIAACTAARECRARGHTGPITMIGADADGCYARPPLSKICAQTRCRHRRFLGSDRSEHRHSARRHSARTYPGIDVVHKVGRTARAQRHPFD
jgi:hypothetical protein